MANPDKPIGASPLGAAKASKYVAGGACYPGDFVTLNNAGKVVQASASQALIGVAASYASADAQDILVYDDPDQRFIVQSDDATAPAAQTAVGLNYNIVASSASTTYKLSRMELDGDSGVTTPSTLPLRLIGLYQSSGNAFGGNAECIVTINNHQLGKNTVGL
jgi:hypothetical protein